MTFSVIESVNSMHRPLELMRHLTCMDGAVQESHG